MGVYSNGVMFLTSLLSLDLARLRQCQAHRFIPVSVRYYYTRKQRRRMYVKCNYNVLEYIPLQLTCKHIALLEQEYFRKTKQLTFLGQDFR